MALQKELAFSNDVDLEIVGLRDRFTEVDLPRWEPLRPKVADVVGPSGLGYSRDLVGLLSNNADLAYGAVLWKYPSWALMHWQNRFKKPVVLAPHGSLDAWALRNSRWKKRIAAMLFKNQQLRQATCFRALCKAEAEAIRAYGLTQRIEVVPNGVELPEKLTTEDTESTEGKKRLLFLGRIHPKKGLVGSLRAWADIKNSKSKNRHSTQWQFVIAGWDQGGHERELKRLCEELGLNVFSFQGSVFSGQEPGDLKINSYKLNALPPEAGGADVVFWGPAFGEEKQALLRSAAAFILPSFSEGLPMSVLEAWAYGLPVVMTPECNLPEGFEWHAALEIRNAGSENASWEGLQALLDMSDSDRIEMGKRGRRLVEEKFTWPKVASQMAELYREILGG